MKLFLDTNVVVDFCARREPFFQDAATIIDMGYRKEVELIISALTFVNVAYVLRKVMSQEMVLTKLFSLMEICQVSPIDGEALKAAARSGSKDFEDAVQYFSAINRYADIIITRDASGFKEFNIPVQSPSVFLANCLS
ncbi:MAG: PIN domain-containing protein [Bacteroides sp.]|nr:PIN domain-containing protein [Bacteroides sp.]